MDIDYKKFLIIVRSVIYEFSILAIYGLIQAFLLGDQFLIRLGYVELNGHLASSSYYIAGFFGHQRVVCTFISPNICGLLLDIVIVLALFTEAIPFKQRFIVVSPLVVALCGTMSRSSILALCVAVVGIWWMNKKERIKPKKGFLVKICVGFVILLIALIAVDSLLLDNIFSKMLSSMFTKTINGEDTSMQKHIEDLIKPFTKVITNPFGLGFGRNGPMALEVTKKANAVESSIYLMMYELGIGGALLFFYPYFKFCFEYFLYKKKTVLFGVCTACLVTFFLLPNVQTYEVLFYSYLIMGLFENNGCKNQIMIYNLLIKNSRLNSETPAIRVEND